MVLMRNLWRVLVSIEAAGIDRPVFIVTLRRGRTAESSRCSTGAAKR